MMVKSTNFRNYKINGSIDIKTVTWIKDSHGLFDYEKGETILKETTNDEIDQAEKLLKIEKCNILTKIYQSENNFQIQIQNQSEHQTYIIVRSLKNRDGIQKGYEIHPGDIVKLGRVEFRVIECKYYNKIKSMDDHSNNKIVRKDKFYEEFQKTTCRICLSDDVSIEGDFIPINPCACKGSCEFVHLACLKHWMASKISKKISGSTIQYKTKYLECEVCKQPLPRQVQIGDKNYDIIDIYKPEMCPYIMLETLSKDKNLPQGLFVVQIISEEPIKLGRGHVSDIRISDISVSRLHAFIKFQQNKFILIDNNSKFGTLVQINNTYDIINDTVQDKMAIQIGRTVITFAVKSIENHQDQQQNKTLSQLQQQKMQQQQEDEEYKL